MQMTPGRIAALAIGVPFAISLVGWTSYSFVALIGQGTVQIAAPVTVYNGAVTADIGGGDVLIRQVPGKAELTGTGQYSLIRPVVTEAHTGAGTSIGYQCRSFSGNCGLNATLQIPPGTGVTLSTGGGNMSVPAFNGSLQLFSGGGDVDAGNLNGTVLMQTDGGNVDADSLSGSLDLQTGGGDLDASTVSGGSRFQARTDGGNVNVQTMADPDATIESSGGDVSLTFGQVSPQNLQISTDGGNIVVVLPPGATTYDIQANTDGGNLVIGSSVTDRGDAEDSLILDSGGGDITVTQAG